MNSAAPAKPANRASRPRERGILIKEPNLQKQQEQQAEVEALDPKCKRKGKKKIKKASVDPLRDSIPSPLRRARKEAVRTSLEKRLGCKDKETWLLELVLLSLKAHISLKR